MSDEETPMGEVYSEEKPPVRKTKKPPKKADKYCVLVGLSYKNKRAEAGECVTDLPPESVEWLLRDGCVKKCEED